MTISSPAEEVSMVSDASTDFPRQGSLGYKAYIQLEEMIVTLVLPAGSTVSEIALSQQLGIGRTPIREALQRLAREGLVVVLPRRGILISEVNVKTQLKLLETRRELERLLARLAARRAAASERTRCSEIADGFENAARENDEKRFMRLDREFNSLTISAARNPFAASAMGLMSGLSRRFWFIHYMQVGDMPLAAKLHAQVARFIASGDEAAAEKASDELMDYLEAFYRATFDPDVG